MFCCDYDALTTYEPGSFCSQHRTDLTGRIERVNLNAITDMDDLNISWLPTSGFHASMLTW